MELYQEILTKNSINDRIVDAMNIILNTKMVPDKSSLAMALKCKPAKFSEVLNFRMKAGIDMAAILCEFFDISPEWLLLSRGSFFSMNERPPIFVNQGPGSKEYINYINAYRNRKKQDTKEDTKQSSTITNGDTSPLLSMITEKDNIIREQAEEIGRLRERLYQLEKEKQKTGSSATNANEIGVANVG